jgi:hypothetical protein
MKKPIPNLADDVKHFQMCHERWLALRNRRMEDPDFRDEWYGQQCGACVYFVYLTGAFVNDWGACSNPDSQFDGQVRFEHDGCEQFEEASNA